MHHANDGMRAGAVNVCRAALLLGCGVMFGCGGVASTYVENTSEISRGASKGAARPVRSWMIATTGDQPPSCHERLATDGVGPDEDPLGLPLEIIHLNEMVGARLVALSYSVDGQCAFSWHHDGGYRHSVPDQLNVMRTQLSPGEHEVQLVAEYGPVMPAAGGYRMTVRGAYVIDLGSATRLFVTGYERGGLETPIDKSVALRFELGELTTPPVMMRRR